MSDKVLVTGATGFIGRALVRWLHDAGREVIALGSVDGDIRQRATLARFADSGVRSVIHLAGRSYVPDSWADPATFLETNFVGTVNALDFCRAAGARFVFVSAYIYGVPDRLPIDETAPVRPNNPYAQSKAIAEEICRFYAERYSVSVTTLRPFNVYGPGQPANFLIPTILRQVGGGEAIEVMDLEPRRDWVFVADVAEAIAAAERRHGGYNLYNIGSGVSYSVAEVIEAVQRVARTDLKVHSRTVRRTNEIPDTVANNARARHDLGWSPRHDLGAGIAACWEEQRKQR